MGIDAYIYCKTTDGKDPDLCDSLPVGAELRAASHWMQEEHGATHEIDTPWRYYSPGYERGPWPRIVAVLMSLYACENVETVWYFGDSFSETHRPFTPEQVQEYSAHYMANGSRPYYGKPKQQRRNDNGNEDS